MCKWFLSAILTDSKLSIRVGTEDDAGAFMGDSESRETTRHQGSNSTQSVSQSRYRLVESSF